MTGNVDVNRCEGRIKIFSKSGRDSTVDRAGLLKTVRKSLRLDKEDCQIKRQCILEGELLVWNDRYRRIEPFHRIRRHIKRSGCLIGTREDSPVDLNEHPMIIFYDVLLLDDVGYIKNDHHTRRRVLESLIDSIPGRT